MKSRQPQLELFAVKPEDPNVTWLKRLLRRHGGWLKAKTIIMVSGNRVDDRYLRVLAHAAAPAVISGQRGYKHTDHATAEEINHFYNQMRSQGVEMLKRAVRVKRYAHARIG